VANREVLHWKLSLNMVRSRTLSLTTFSQTITLDLTGYNIGITLPGLWYLPPARTVPGALTGRARLAGANAGAFLGVSKGLRLDATIRRGGQEGEECCTLGKTNLPYKSLGDDV
jgi:hypothetical protein